jgi:hypothetical protein
MRLQPTLLLSIACLAFVPAGAAAAKVEINPRLLTHHWPAHWICHPEGPASEFGVYHFRRDFELGEKPGKFIIHVSADNRYRLFVNGQPVSQGPSRGDILRWRFETVDIAPQLKQGKNTLAAGVWNFGEYMPLAQISREMLNIGLTTFAERPEPTRSDCHAWSSSPNYEFLATVSGIEPGSPGFRTVRIEPFLGPLREVNGKMPHPRGDIQVHFQSQGAGGLKGEVLLPAGLTGELLWNGRILPLSGGRQTVEVNQD